MQPVIIDMRKQPLGSHEHILRKVFFQDVVMQFAVRNAAF